MSFDQVLRKDILTFSKYCMCNGQITRHIRASHFITIYAPSKPTINHISRNIARLIRFVHVFFAKSHINIETVLC